ncbi:MAG: metallophosphoesterase family protein [Myxococcota bacterium]
MKLAHLSDLHLAPGRMNRCTTPHATLTEDIERLLDTCDHVVLVGDLFDLLRPRRVRGWRAELDALEREAPGLMRALRRADWVFGNHDVPLAALGTPEERVFLCAGRGALVTHGHQRDPWLKRVWGLSEVANFTAGWLERAGLSPLAQALGDVPWLLEDSSRRGARRQLGPATRTAAYAYDAMCTSGMDIVAFGHTHALGLLVVPGGLLINTGSHTCGSRDEVWLDLSTGDVEARRDGHIVGRASRSATGAWSVEGDPHFVNHLSFQDTGSR